MPTPTPGANGSNDTTISDEFVQAIITKLEEQFEMQTGYYHWSLALAGMTIGLLVITIVALIWGRK
jgi:hypothetical protein